MNVGRVPDGDGHLANESDQTGENALKDNEEPTVAKRRMEIFTQTA